MSMVNIQLIINHDVNSRLLRSDIIDWVSFQDIMYSKTIDEVITFVLNEYDDTYIETIPELNSFLELLYETKREADKILGTTYHNARIKAVFEEIVVISVTYNKYRETKEV